MLKCRTPWPWQSMTLHLPSPNTRTLTLGSWYDFILEILPLLSHSVPSAEIPPFLDVFLIPFLLLASMHRSLQFATVTLEASQSSFTMSHAGTNESSTGLCIYPCFPFVGFLVQLVHKSALGTAKDVMTFDLDKESCLVDLGMQILILLDAESPWEGTRPEISLAAILRAWLRFGNFCVALLTCVCVLLFHHIHTPEKKHSPC